MSQFEGGCCAASDENRGVMIRAGKYPRTVLLEKEIAAVGREPRISISVDFQFLTCLENTCCLLHCMKIS